MDYQNANANILINQYTNEGNNTGGNETQTATVPMQNSVYPLAMMVGVFMIFTGLLMPKHQ